MTQVIQINLKGIYQEVSTQPMQKDHVSSDQPNEGYHSRIEQRVIPLPATWHLILFNIIYRFRSPHEKFVETSRPSSSWTWFFLFWISNFACKLGYVDCLQDCVSTTLFIFFHLSFFRIKYHPQSTSACNLYPYIVLIVRVIKENIVHTIPYTNFGVQDAISLK